MDEREACGRMMEMRQGHMKKGLPPQGLRSYLSILRNKQIHSGEKLLSGNKDGLKEMRLMGGGHCNSRQKIMNSGSRQCHPGPQEETHV